MSLYSRYSESSISVSYFSRSSALICSASFSGPFGRVGFHLSPPIVSVSTRWPGLGAIARPALGDHPTGCHPPNIDEGMPMLGTRAQLVQRLRVRHGAVALVFGKPIA